MGDFLNLSGNYNGFVNDTAQNATKVSKATSYDHIEVSVPNISRFVVGNIVRMEGSVYLGNFKVAAVGNGVIKLKTPYISGIDGKPHTVTNLTRFSDSVVEAARQLRDVKRGDSGLYKDATIYSVLPVNPLEPVGLVAGIYRRFKKNDEKGTLALDEVEYLTNYANSACARTKGSTFGKCKNYVAKKYPKLYDGETKTAGATLNEAGLMTSVQTTENQSQAASRLGKSDSGSSSKGGKILLFAVLGIGAILLVRQIIKK